MSVIRYEFCITKCKILQVILKIQIGIYLVLMGTIVEKMIALIDQVTVENVCALVWTY